ncbi:hypothetical protein PoB_004246000 [Plakobranchus ocellatus]|uniref:Uncharacterized protein n=1 Tax=Plakobranchus ocellatus TaxID=259542 RepID=A0AAV4B5V8_9GAST|nr:hypothetical protein PoB_004246000 [Plakobranchus ocellatus]
MEELEELGSESREPHIKADPFLTQTCNLHLTWHNETNNPAVIVLHQPRDFVDLLTERLHVLDADSCVELSTNNGSSNLSSLHEKSPFSFFRAPSSSGLPDISPLDTKLFMDASGTESDDSGFHNFTDVNFFSRDKSLLENCDDKDDVVGESDLMQSLVYNSSMDLNSVDGNNNMNDFEGCDSDLMQNTDIEDEDEDESDDDSESSNSSDDDDDSGGSSGSSSSDDMDDDKAERRAVWLFAMPVSSTHVLIQEGRGHDQTCSSLCAQVKRKFRGTVL